MINEFVIGFIVILFVLIGFHYKEIKKFIEDFNHWKKGD